MAKKFVLITQTWHTTAIIDIPDGEATDKTLQRIQAHIQNNGGPETVLCLGGEIKFSVRSEKPTKEDEDSFECID